MKKLNGISNMGKINLNTLISEFKKIHGDKYDYSLVNYINTDTKITIICPIHGEFEQTPYKHKNGQQCKKCAYENNSLKFKKNSDKFIEDSKLIHGDKYDYSKVIYKNNKDKVIIICPTHGEFEQTPNSHLKYGCKYCGYDSTRKSNKLFIEQSIQINGGKYDYSNVNYVKSNKPIKLICPIHGEFEQTPKNHLSQKQGCPKCTYRVSKLEKELQEFISNLGIEFEETNRTILNNKELDIYIPSHNLAIEFNGLYWHCELFKDKNYHLDKTNECESKGIRLIHIFEDEWLYKQDIVKSRIKNILGFTKNRIYARKCEIKEVSNKDSKLFLNENHIQGNVSSKINLGLYYNDELVSLITFGKRPLFNNCEYELIRFCNKLDSTIIGGASKLLNYFIKNYKPKEIISYTDRRWNKGDLYNKLNFKFIEDTEPSWFIISGNNRYHRVKYQKHKLIDMGFDKSKTAHQICLENGMYRIYDCGTKKYKLII
jgi:hypothetical protein